MLFFERRSFNQLKIIALLSCKKNIGTGTDWRFLMTLRTLLYYSKKNIFNHQKFFQYPRPYSKCFSSFSLSLNASVISIKVCFSHPSSWPSCTFSIMTSYARFCHSNATPPLKNTGSVVLTILYYISNSLLRSSSGAWYLLLRKLN